MEQKKINNGTAIASVISYNPCYIGNGKIIYRNNSDGGKLYLKSSTRTDNGTAITSVSSWCPCYIGNGQIVYTNFNDGGKLYLKSATGTDNGTAITSVRSYFPCYIGNGQIVYQNYNDDKLYLKSSTGTDNGTAITSVRSYEPCYIGNGQIVYQNYSDGGKLYLKSATGTDNGSAVTNARANFPCYISNGQIVYVNDSDGGKLYLKSVTDRDNGKAINSMSSCSPCYIGNGQIVYVNYSDDDRKLYLLDLKELDLDLTFNDQEEAFNGAFEEEKLKMVLNEEPLKRIGVKENKNKLNYFTVLFNQFPNAIESIAKCSEIGHQKYKEFDKDYQNFRKVEGGVETYLNAMIRHLIKYKEISEDSTDELCVYHIEQMLWNAVAAVELFKCKQDK